MRTTLNINDDVLEQAQALSPSHLTKTEIVNAALKAYVQKLAAKEITKYAGSAPNAKAAPRRRL